jgi:hypothetical protein
MQKTAVKILAVLITMAIVTQWSDAYTEFGIRKATFTSLGYHIKSQENGSPSLWEKEHFDLLEKRSVQIRSVKPMPGSSNTFYRFTISEEKYPSESEAVVRLDRLLDMPPDLHVEDQKAFPLRRGFQAGNLVYVVSTDVSLFTQELENLSKNLQKAVSKAKSGKQIHESF